MYRSRRNRSTGQTSLEFMSMLIFVMLIFAAFYSFIASEQLAAQEEQELLMGEAISNKAAFEVRLALTEGDGYTRNFTLPHQLRGTDYTVSVDSGVLFVEWNDRRMIADPVVDTITGTITPGENRIRNVEGEIYVD